MKKTNAAFLVAALIVIALILIAIFGTSDESETIPSPEVSENPSATKTPTSTFKGPPAGAVPYVNGPSGPPPQY